MEIVVNDAFFNTFSSFINCMKILLTHNGYGAC